GGFVAIPLLTGWLRLTQHQAHGTSLGAVCATGAAGAAGFAAAGQVDWMALPPMVVAGMVTSTLGAKATGRLKQSTLKRMLGVFMIGIAPVVIFRDQLLEYAHRPVHGEEPLHSNPNPSNQLGGAGGDGGGEHKAVVATAAVERPSSDPLRMAAIGACSGFLAGIFGVGGGAVTVPAISLCTDFTHKEALGLSLAAMVLPAVSGGFVHYRAGNLLPAVAVPLAVGTALGAYVSSTYVVQNVSNDTLKYAFAAFMATLGFRTLRSATPVRQAAANAAARISKDAVQKPKVK
ncbi:sulfite exporter TauE/SafE-domain-containing protein, partial [Tribonema minus]